MSTFLRTLDPFRDLREIEKRMANFCPSEPKQENGFVLSLNTRKGRTPITLKWDLPSMKKKIFMWKSKIIS